jgi:hypothetical protein
MRHPSRRVDASHAVLLWLQPGGATAGCPSARKWLEQRDAVLGEPGMQAEIDDFREGLRDIRPPEPVDWLCCSG